MIASFVLPEELMRRRAVTANGCWEWAGTRRNGYGRIWWNGKIRTVHRLAAHFALGLDLDQRWVLALHHCDNPPCFNPDHLFIGSPADNNRDRDAKGRAVRAYTYAPPRPLIHPRVRACDVCSSVYEPDADHRGRSVVCSAECLSRLRSVSRRGNSSSLTPDDVRAIRAALATGKRGTGALLAEQYGVSRSVITYVKQGKTWGWVE